MSNNFEVTITGSMSLGDIVDAINEARGIPNKSVCLARAQALREAAVYFENTEGEDTLNYLADQATSAKALETEEYRRKSLLQAKIDALIAAGDKADELWPNEGGCAGDWLRDMAGELEMKL